MSFDSAYAETSAWEAGWYPGDLASDTNPTLNGVTQARYDQYRDAEQLPRQSVQQMSADEQQQIYFSYWAAAHCSALPPLTASVVFDHAFNAGAVAAIEVLQSALGLSPDGVWGPQTAAAVAALTPAQDATVAENVLWARLGVYYKIALNPVKRPNLESWVGRVLGCRRAVLAATP